MRKKKLLPGHLQEDARVTSKPSKLPTQAPFTYDRAQYLDLRK